MEFRHLGNSGMKVSAIAYGNWVTHGSQIQSDAATACVRAALAAGISTFDTADVYANTVAEEILGTALNGVPRREVEVFTKVYFPTNAGKHNDTGLSRKHIRESIDASLQRLQMEYVDLYQCHRYDVATPLEETCEALAQIVHAGKALYIGVSEWTADQIRTAHSIFRELRVPFVSNQPHYSMIWRIIEPNVIPTCQELGIGQVVFSPLEQGILTGKYLPGQPAPEGSRAMDERGKRFIQKHLDDQELLSRVQLLKPLAEAEGLTMAQFALAWVLSNPGVSSAIAGASRPEQITAAAEAADHQLNSETMAKIDLILGDKVIKDPGLVGDSSPKERLV